MQGIYTYIPQTNYVLREYSVAAILLLLFIVLISLVYYYYYYYYATFFQSLQKQTEKKTFVQSQQNARL